MNQIQTEQDSFDVWVHADSQRLTIVVILVGILLAALLVGTGVAANSGQWVQVADPIEDYLLFERMAGGISLSDNGGRAILSHIDNVIVYELQGNEWSQLGNTIDEQGFVAISADGNRIAVGNKRSHGLPDGYVRVFELQNGHWVQLGATFDDNDRHDSPPVFFALSESGHRIAITSEPSPTAQLATRVYELQDDNWHQVGNAIYNHVSGMTLSANGEYVAIGNRSVTGVGNGAYPGAPGIWAGGVRVFNLVGDSWTQVGDEIGGEWHHDYMGAAISLSASGQRLALGAKQNDASGRDNGHVRVFEIVDGVWTQMGADIDGLVRFNHLGRFVSLSNNGTTVAASDKDSVHVYHYLDGSWVQAGSEISSIENVVGGYPMTLSGDGSRIMTRLYYRTPSPPDDGYPLRQSDFVTGMYSFEYDEQGVTSVDDVVIEGSSRVPLQLVVASLALLLVGLLVFWRRWRSA